MNSAFSILNGNKKSRYGKSIVKNVNNYFKNKITNFDPYLTLQTQRHLISIFNHFLTAHPCPRLNIQQPNEIVKILFHTDILSNTFYNFFHF